jgi:hypothetical protein
MSKNWMSIAAIATVFAICSHSTIVVAQAPQQFMDFFGVINQAIVSNAQSQWQAVSNGERECLEQLLQAGGVNIQGLINQGVLPSDPRISTQRRQCRQDVVSRDPSTRAQLQPYKVGAIQLGSIINPQAQAGFNCKQSDRFLAFHWCTKKEGGSEKRGKYDAYYTVMSGENGEVVYANRYQEPAFFAEAEVNEEIQNISRRYGAPNRNENQQSATGRTMFIATWGALELQQVEDDAIEVFKSDKTPGDGLFADYIGNFVTSANEGLPIFRIAGGPGFAYIGHYKSNGRGTLRFFAADASRYMNESPSTVAANTPVGNDIAKSWRLIDVNVKTCVNRLLQTVGQSIDMLIAHGVAASDAQVSPHLSKCQNISSHDLMRNFDCVLDVGPTRCDEAYVLASAQTTPLTTEQVTTAFLSDHKIGKTQIENSEARNKRLVAVADSRKAMIAEEGLKKLRPLLNPDNKLNFGKATELRKQIEGARSNPRTTEQDLEKLNASASDLLKAYNEENERLRIIEEGWASRGEAKVSGQGSEASEKAARINAYYDILEKQLRDLIGGQADGAIGQQFRKNANTSFDKFRTDFFTSATKDACKKANAVFTCSVEGVFKLGSLKSEVQKIMGAANKSYRFILGYEETDSAPTRFLIDKIRAEFVNSGYIIIAKSGEEEARAQGKFDYYLNILDIEYDDSASDVGSIGGAGTNLFENYILKARVKLLDNKKDPVARQELANVPVINTKRVARDTAMPRDVRRNQLLPMQASELARQIYRDVSARLLKLANAQGIGENGTGVLAPGHYSIKIVGLTQRDREKIRALRNAVSKVLPGTETMEDPNGTNDKSVEIRFEHTGKFDPADLVDAIYLIFKESKTFKFRNEGNNSFVGSL